MNHLQQSDASSYYLSVLIFYLIFEVKHAPLNGAVISVHARALTPALTAMPVPWVPHHAPPTPFLHAILIH